MRKFNDLRISDSFIFKRKISKDTRREAALISGSSLPTRLVDLGGIRNQLQQ